MTFPMNQDKIRWALSVFLALFIILLPFRLYVFNESFYKYEFTKNNAYFNVRNADNYAASIMSYS